MKKIICFYVAVLSSLVFLQLFQTQSQYDFFTFNDYVARASNDSKKELLSFEVSIHNQETHEKVVDLLSDYGKKYNRSIINSFSESDDQNNHIVTHNLYIGSIDILSPLILKDESKIDFNDTTEKGFYSTKKNDIGSVNLINILDSTMLEKSNSVFRFAPFNQSKKSHEYTFDNTVVYNILCNDKDKEQIQLESFLKQVDPSSKYNLNPIIWTSTWQEIYHDDIKNLKILIPIMLIVLILTISTWTIKQTSKIMIMRLHGHSSLKILHHFFFPLFLLLNGICVATMLLMYRFIIHSPSPATARFDQELLNLTLLFILSFCIIYILIYIYIRFMFALKYLKTKPNLTNILNINLAAKIILAILIIAPFLTITNEAFPITKTFLDSWRNEDEISSQYTISGAFMNDAEVLEAFLPISKYDDFMLNSINKQTMDYPIDVDFITVNKKYLQDYEIMDSQNNPLDYHKLKSGDLLIPEKYEYRDNQIYCQTTECVEIIIQNNFVFKPHQPVLSSVKDPIIIYVDKYSPSLDINSTNLYLSKDKPKSFYESKLDKILDKQNYRLVDNKNTLHEFYPMAKEKILKLGSILFVYFAIYFSFVYQSTFIFLDQSKKKLSIQYIQGVPRKDRYLSIYLSNSLIYLIPFFISVIYLKLPLYSCMIFFGCIILLEFLTTTYMIYRFEIKNIASILKGEDDYE